MYLYKICTYIVCWDFKVFCLTMHSPEKQNQTFHIILLKLKKKDKKQYQSDFNSCSFNIWFKLRSFVCNWARLCVCVKIQNFWFHINLFNYYKKSLTSPCGQCGVKCVWEKNGHHRFLCIFGLLKRHETRLNHFFPLWCNNGRLIFHREIICTNKL